MTPTDITPPEDHEREDSRIVYLSEKQIDEIADRVEGRFLRRFGRLALDKLLKLIGLVTIGLVLWLAGKGVLPK